MGGGGGEGRTPLQPYFGQCELQPPLPSHAFLPAQSWDSGTAQLPRPRHGFLPMQQFCSGDFGGGRGDGALLTPGLAFVSEGGMRSGAPLQLARLTSCNAASAEAAPALVPLTWPSPPRPG